MPASDENSLKHVPKLGPGFQIPGPGAFVQWFCDTFLGSWHLRTPIAWRALAALALGLGTAGCGGKGPPAAGLSEPSAAETAAPGQGSAAAGGPTTDLFVDVARKAGIDFVHFNGMSGEFYICEVKCSGAGLLDYDNDGDLDIYLIQGAMLGPGKTLADATFPPKDLLRPPKDRLYRNDLVVHADGSRTLHFTDVTEQSGIDSTGFGIGVTTGDYDNDGWIDIYVTTMNANELLHNNGDGTFSNVTGKAAVQDTRATTPARRFWTTIAMAGSICSWPPMSISTTPRTRHAIRFLVGPITRVLSPSRSCLTDSSTTGAMGRLKMCRPHRISSRSTAVVLGLSAPT